MLRVVGVGGGGVNAVNRMVEAEVEGVEFLAINTDLQSLQQSAAHATLHSGDGITRGLGSGSGRGGSSPRTVAGVLGLPAHPRDCDQDD